MIIDNKGNYTVIKAEDGFFIANTNMTIYGLEIILGKYDSPENYIEHPIEEWPEEPDPNEASTESMPQNEETVPQTNESHINPLAIAKAAKMRDIYAYDNSTNVNGFLFNGSVKWLDRETRSSLRNTIESAELVGRSELDIWFGDIYVTLPLNDARMMLAVLEVYATDCYNVTSQHKAQVRSFETVEEVEAFDVTAGYPQMPVFGNAGTNE